MTAPGPEASRAPEAAPSAVELGQGRYVVVGSLGAGSQAETLDAVDKREGRAVAIKRFTIRGAKSWKDVELAEREASVLSSLSHSSLPRYIEHFEENGALYLVMEKIEGETLAARRRRGAALEQAQIMRFLREAAICLGYLHGHAPPIVHRDIKPGNVILRPDGSYCLVDFGSVRDRLKPEGGSTVVGTFGYMAPEQFQGRAGPASDVYAAAATALSLLTGSEPEDLPHRGLGIDVEAALRGQVDRRLIMALLRMLEPDPDRRPSSIDAALRAAGLHAAERPAAPGSAASAKQARKARVAASQSHRREERADRKATRRAERYERVRSHPGWHRPGRPGPPGIVIGIAILLALRLAAFGTFALFQLLLPLLFTLLAVFGGRVMFQRGQRLREIGRTGQRGLSQAGRHVRYHFMGGPDPFAFQAAPGAEPAGRGPRTRVSSDPAARDASDAEAEAQQAEPGSLDRERGRH